jgi:hypothetical protein
MSELDKAYFERRAEQEIELACISEETAAVSAHYELACAYLDRIYPQEEDGAPPTE